MENGHSGLQPSRTIQLGWFIPALLWLRHAHCCFVLLFCCLALPYAMNAQTPYKLRILLYGPTTDFAEANYEVNFINNHPAEFQPIGTGGTDSQIWTEQQWINASKASFAAFDAIVFSDKGENGEK